MQGNIFENTISKDVNPKSKTGMVLKHLIEHDKITSWDAIMLYRATRLSSIIFNLKQYGYNIVCTKMKGKDGVYGEYSLLQKL